MPSIGGRVDLHECSPIINSETREQSRNDTGYEVMDFNAHRNGCSRFETDDPQDDSDSSVHNGGEKKSPSMFKFFTELSDSQRSTLILTTLAAFLQGVAFSQLGPFYSSEATKKGMSLTLVGLVFSVFQLVIFVTAPLFGNYLVKIGPKFVFTAGVFVGGSCIGLFGVLEYCPGGSPYIVMSLLIRSVAALGCSGYLTAGFAILAGEFTDNVGFTYGILETGSGLGYMLGPTIGGTLYEYGGFGLPFYVAGTMELLCGLAVYRFLPPLKHMPSRREGSVFSLLRSPMVVLPAISNIVGVIGITTYDSTFSKHLEPLGTSVGLIGVLYGLVAVVFAIMSMVWGYISDAKNIQSPIIIGGHLMFGLGFSLLGPSFLVPFVPFNMVTIVIGLACLGVSYGCLQTPAMKCMVLGTVELGFDEASIDTYALVSGLYNSLHTLGGATGPVGVGFLVQHFGYPMGYGVVASLSFFMMAVSFVFFTYRKLRSRRDVVQAKKTVA